MIFTQAGNPSKMSQWVFDTYEKKQNLANNISTNKIIIVAGSNALFGINSKKLSKAFNKPVINYGVNAGIELPLTLHLSKKIIKHDDIVILPLEYPMYSYDGEMGIQMIDYLISREPNYFWNLTLKEKFNLIWKIELKRVLEGFFNKSNSKVEVGLYGYNKIDNFGDQIKTDIKYRLNVYFNSIKLDAENYANEFTENTIAWDYISEFVKWCNKRSVKVIFVPTTLMKHENYLTIDKWYYESLPSLVKNKGYKFVGNPLDYMYEKDFYFDTNYHLINRARNIRTDKLIEDLKEIL